MGTTNELFWHSADLPNIRIRILNLLLDLCNTHFSCDLTYRGHIIKLHQSILFEQKISLLSTDILMNRAN